MDTDRAIDRAISAVYNCIDQKIDAKGIKNTIFFALMKQVPLKVDRGYGYYLPRCPACGLKQDRTPNYCEKCGQRLDFRLEE